MKRYLCAAVALVACLSVRADAHFVLVAPGASFVQSRLGDPQKLGPCGGTSADPGTPSGVLTTVRGGEMLHLMIQETIFHPGHYRVALAPSPTQLPANPAVVTRESERGPISVSAPIDPRPALPVLADGLFVHTAKVAEMLEADVAIPNINCEKCTLQVTQFMAEHGFNRDGGYFYHHCADVRITADAAKPLDRAWPFAR